MQCNAMIYSSTSKIDRSRKSCAATRWDDKRRLDHSPDEYRSGKRRIDHSPDERCDKFEVEALVHHPIDWSPCKQMKDHTNDIKNNLLVKSKRKYYDEPDIYVISVL